MATIERTGGSRPLQWRKGVAITLQIAVHLGALAPLLWLFLAIRQGALGGDPVKELIHFLGLGALRLLMLTLLVSPLARGLSLGQLNRLRRPLGLWCFAWALLHFSAWLGLELVFDWSLIASELVERTYILVGFAALLLLLALAATSLPALMRRMGRNWKKLHGFIYPLALLACWHFWWSVKSGWIEPAAYLAIALGLLALRRNGIARWLRSVTPAVAK
ncbi:protein-methionine-sulfoxide reductase heme-binding subunit MsrQ [Microbulbifer halophilus]|uniref:Protein-methionine-sulfoxide reductase heme-binding subunit MsrQ n=1 Tax=Microbulbifer halophilus TaxID=453963 RepID=A0ABW5EFZ4_9GAMM|nr:protein-methionine-sulfoxide reductase heme-binding subunit MsrQ [Microbulbifer halophilus]MCW8125972.1 sulfoxide reductase heme-binding subunit YedZ [Microbulbifer halophilus]